MGDSERFKQLIEGGDSCISIVTYEERYALDTIRHTALDLKCSLWVWSVASGVKEGFLATALISLILKRPLPAFITLLKQSKPLSVSFSISPNISRHAQCCGLCAT